MITKLVDKGNIYGKQSVVKSVVTTNHGLLSGTRGNGDLLDCLRVVDQNGNKPNILWTGPPGCSETPAKMALARQMLGAQFKNALFERNLANDRIIDTFKNKSKRLAQIKVMVPPGRHKSVVRDEAHCITAVAQQELRRTIDLHGIAFADCQVRIRLSSPLQNIKPIQNRSVVFCRLTDPETSARVAKMLSHERVS